MAATKPIDNRFETLLGMIKQQQDAWRRAMRGGVVAVSLDDYERKAVPQNVVYGFSQLSLGDLDEIAEYMSCAWAINQSKRLIYFIPLEMLGEQGR